MCIRRLIKLVAICISAGILAVSLISCLPVDTNDEKNGDNTPTSYTIAFDTRGGTAIKDVVVDAGASFKYPPAKKTGMAFSHWCVDSALETRFAYGGTVDSDMTLYAVYAGIDDFVALDTPAIIITTENAAPIESKDDYLNALVTVTNADESYCFEGKSAGIRGRGNYTWTLDKKGYRIKFDKKIGMLGEEPAKNWTLIPNHTDKSLMRNYLALSFAGRLDGLMWNSSARYIDVYINGAYRGLYLLCEQNQVDENRVNIEEGGSDVDTGYFIERDRYALSEAGMTEGVDYFCTTPPGAPIVPGDSAAFCYALKTPASDDDSYTPAHFDYIKQYITNVENSIVNGDYATFTSLCNEQSFIDYFMVDQVFTNWEANRLSSCYMFKDKGGKLFMGPLWDFDLSVGFAPEQHRNVFVTSNYWFVRLMRMPQFKEKFKARYYELEAELSAIFEDIGEVRSSHALAINHNFERWDITTPVYPENYNSDTPMQYLKSHKAHTDFVERFLLDRIAFLNTNMKNW